VVDGSRNWNWSARESCTQRFAVKQLRHDIWRAALLADVMNREDVWMVERSGGAGFLPESRQALGIAAELGWQDFDRHVAPQPRVARSIDLPHAAGTQRRQDFVRSELRARDQAHQGKVGRL